MNELKKIIASQSVMIQKLLSDAGIDVKLFDKNDHHSKTADREFPSNAPVNESGEISFKIINSKDIISSDVPQSSKSPQQKMMEDLIFVEKDTVENCSGPFKFSKNESGWSDVKSRKNDKIIQPSSAAKNITDDEHSLAPRSQLQGVRKSSVPIIGTQKSNILHAAKKKTVVFIHVSELDPATNPTELEHFIGQCISNITCGKLNSMKPEIYSSFKITVVAVKRFFTKRSQNIRSFPKECDTQFCQ
ncbi:hypothetical protein WA026_016502 [Henosepilachna vigintioctopunctata]|uniref:Uncharacterized protein n=1 Tax=Henosepilachna vigintioctopunctata TaxID=420089 RepID=A0AAW1VHH1_9CUCU